MIHYIRLIHSNENKIYSDIHFQQHLKFFNYQFFDFSKTVYKVIYKEK